MRHRQMDRKATLLCVVAVLIIIFGIGWLMMHSVFVVRNVVIEGPTTAAAQEIIRSSKLNFGSFINSFDRVKLKENVESSGQYVLEDVRVRYPNTIVMNVRDRSKDALVLTGGYVLVLDAEGYVAMVSTTLPDVNAVYITGLNISSYKLGRRVEAKEDRLAAMKTVIEAMHKHGADVYVSELNVNNPSSLTIVTRTGIQVQLGNQEGMDAKLLWMRSAVADLESRGQTTGVLDVSSGNKADYRAKS